MNQRVHERCQSGYDPLRNACAEAPRFEDEGGNPWI